MMPRSASFVLLLLFFVTVSFVLSSDLGSPGIISKDDAEESPLKRQRLETEKSEIMCIFCHEDIGDAKPLFHKSCGKTMHLSCLEKLFKESTTGVACPTCGEPISYMKFMSERLSYPLTEDFVFNPVLMVGNKEKEQLFIKSLIRNDSILAVQNLISLNYIDLDSHLFMDSYAFIELVAGAKAVKVLAWLLETRTFTEQLLNKALVLSFIRVCPDCVALLLKHGADVNCSSSGYGTPLEIAIRKNSLPSIKLLLANKARVNQATTTQRYPLHLAVSLKVDIEIITQLLDAGADMNARNSSQLVPVQLTFVKDNVEAFKLFIERGARRDVFMSGGLTLFHQAIAVNALQIVKYCVSQSLSIELRSGQHSYLIHHVVSGANSSPEMLEFLLSSGADVNEQMDDGFLSLLQRDSKNLCAKRFTKTDPATANAILAGREEMLEILLKHGADPNARIFNNTTTLLHLTVELKLNILFKLLVDFGADTNAIDSRGRTAKSLIPEDRKKFYE